MPLLYKSSDLKIENALTQSALAPVVILITLNIDVSRLLDSAFLQATFEFRLLRLAQWGWRDSAKEGLTLN